MRSVPKDAVTLKATPGLTALEGRETPAAVSAFNPATGALTDTIQPGANQDAYVNAAASGYGGVDFFKGGNDLQGSVDMRGT